MNTEVDEHLPVSKIGEVKDAHEVRAKGIVGSGQHRHPGVHVVLLHDGSKVLLVGKNERRRTRMERGGKG